METIKRSDLISTGFDEVYYEFHKCPKCGTNGISETDNYCSGCGIKIVK